MMPTQPAPSATSTRPQLVLDNEEIEVMPGVFLSKPTRSASSNSTNPQRETPAQQHWTHAYASALSELPSDSLVAEFKALGNSRDHLVRSNQELEEFAEAESDPVERQQLRDIIQENMAILPTFKVKQALVATALQKRGVDLGHSLGIQLVDSSSTPNVPAATAEPAPAPSASTESSSMVQQHPSTSVREGSQDHSQDQEEGVFL